MHGWLARQIRDAHPDVFTIATYDDFRHWNLSWTRQEHLRARVRFWWQAIVRSFAVMGGMIP